ncbi:hypothetical protein V6N12_068632 [Hibiscus sabdariffa]|uniref:Uncharacterized protein n=1 Tax=Hibiscus sabdariffa TaxID=183260 RepID=A0ABR2FQX0_9ROSI
MEGSNLGREAGKDSFRVEAHAEERQSWTPTHARLLRCIGLPGWWDQLWVVVEAVPSGRWRNLRPSLMSLLVRKDGHELGLEVDGRRYVAITC